MSFENESEIRQLFKTCDLNESGFIEPEDLRQVCANLQTTEVNKLFNQLDKNNKGRISFQDFQAGYKNLFNTMANNNYSSNVKNVTTAKKTSTPSQEISNKSPHSLISRNDKNEKSQITTCNGGPPSLDSNYQQFSSGEIGDILKSMRNSEDRVHSFYQQLSFTGNNDVLIHSFEELILGITKDVKTLTSEQNHLEQILVREREENEIRLRQLEEELEGQMTKTEAIIREEEKAKAESELNLVKAKLNAEVRDLQMALQKLQSAESSDRRTSQVDDSAVLSLKQTINDLEIEKRQLQSSLNDVRTNLSVARSEIATIKQRYEETKQQLENEKQSVQDHIKENEKLSQQMTLLNEANKRLHDTNDDIRHALEGAERMLANRNDSSGSRRESIMSNYLPTNHNGRLFRKSRLNSRTPSSAGDSCFHEGDSPDKHSSDEGSEITLGASAASAAAKTPSRNSSLRGSSGTKDSRLINTGNAGSGGSTRISQHSFRKPTIREQFLSNSRDESDTEDESASERTSLNISDLDLRSSSSAGRRPNSLHKSNSIRSTSSRASSRMRHHGTNNSNNNSVSSNLSLPQSRASSRRSSRRSPTYNLAHRLNGVNNNDSISEVISGESFIETEPDRMYKIVLCGDTAVGKSSLIVRLCQDRFAENLTTTLGVDFQTKIVNVDGRAIALQLWDTAGQERFRSIAKSYFRRADGVLMVYDVSYERSFVNVREWMQCVDEATDKEVSIMLVGNKCDMIPALEKAGRSYVRQSQGQNLARESNALFIQTSAKTGDNVQEAVVELARMLRANEDMEVKAAGMRLHESLEKERQAGKNCVPTGGPCEN